MELWLAVLVLSFLEFMNANSYKAEIKMLGLPDRLVEHGTPKELHRECGYDAEAIKETVLEMMKGKISISFPFQDKLNSKYI